MEEVQFPQVRQPFPDVWGTGYFFEVRSRLLDDDSDGLASTSVSCEIAGSEVQTTQTDAEGYATFRLRFKAPGTYTIRTVFAGNDDYRPSDAQRTLRVVDYREEIVRLFHSYLQQSGASIPEETTPREAPRIIRRHVAQVDASALEELVGVFEEADYSTHEMTREQFERAYIARLRLVEPASEATERLQ